MIQETQVLLDRRVDEQLARYREQGEFLFWGVLGGTLFAFVLALFVNSTLVGYARELRLSSRELEQKNRELEDQALELEQQAAELESQATELEEALDTVRENEVLFRSLIENAADMIAVVDRRGRAVFQSPSLLRSRPSGGDPDEPPDFLAGVHVEDRERVLEALKQVRSEPGSTAQFDARLQNEDGSWRQISASARLLPRHSAISGVVINAQDVTEARRLEEQFQHAQRMESVGRLAGGVAHDFSNILGIIKGNVQLMQLDLDRASPLHAELELVNQAADRAAGLVRQLLAFSRKQILQPELIELNELVAETEKMLRRVIGSDIDLRTILDPDLGRINADPGQIQQVLLNLAVNSRDAMPEGGNLVIETKNVRIGEGHEELYPHLAFGTPAVLLSVSDTGHGMDAETQKHIFEPFFSTKEQGKGTGLGLSTVYGIVKQSRGYIWVYSEPGHGTTFKIYLPRVGVGAEPTATPPARLMPAPGEGKILMVEDDPQLRAVMRRLLERGGYTVMEAADGFDALRLCSEEGPNLRLLVSDMVMPQMSGTELARRVHATLPGLPVLFVSGYTDDSLIQSGRLPPGASFIQKPFDTDEFLDAVAQLLEVASG
jgi:two-component system, cell cycle sensor histidine kinase and response regulator CckA